MRSGLLRRNDCKYYELMTLPVVAKSFAKPRTWAQNDPPADIPHGIAVTSVFDTYWKFAAQRQNVFFTRLARPLCFPWTEDPVLIRNKFTNAFRASDRVSQYLIRNICSGEESVNELFFRVVLFKLFNRIETWELLTDAIGVPTWKNYSFARYDAILTKAIESGTKIYSAAYIMPTGGISDRKHRHHLRLLEMMMRDNLPTQLQRSRTMEAVFLLLRSYPSIGNFLAYQLIIDLNYSDFLDFSEMDFVCAGPGARDGMKKCFSHTGGKSEEWLIRWIADTQDVHFERLGLNFRNLWGRRLQLVDCQNLFCEVDKYARSVHPEMTGISGRHRIKQRFRPNLVQVAYKYPEKWKINDNVTRIGADWGEAASRINENGAA
jgi:alpha-glutamyl/putrescinyl thymine pyrophosphorylase clade 1